MDSLGIQEFSNNIRRLQPADGSQVLGDGSVIVSLATQILLKNNQEVERKRKKKGQWRKRNKKKRTGPNETRKKEEGKNKERKEGKKE